MNDVGGGEVLKYRRVAYTRAAASADIARGHHTRRVRHAMSAREGRKPNAIDTIAARRRRLRW